MAANHLGACPSLTTGIEDNCSCKREEEHYFILAKWSFGLFVFELVGGKFSGSLALMSDAVHVLIDGTENLVSAIVSRLARQGDEKEQRVRNVGGTISALLLLSAAGWIIHEGIEHISNPHKVEWYMTFLASIGLGVNLWQKKLHDGAPTEHRNQTHFWQDWHLLSDISASTVVILGGVIMLVAEKWYWIDGVLSVLIGVLIMVLVSAKLLGFDFHGHNHDHLNEHCNHDH